MVSSRSPFSSLEMRGLPSRAPFEGVCCKHFSRKTWKRHDSLFAFQTSKKVLCSRDAQLLKSSPVIFPLQNFFGNRTLHFITFSVSEPVGEPPYHLRDTGPGTWTRSIKGRSVMRLQKLNQVLADEPVSDVVRTVSYRSQLFVRQLINGL